MAVRTETAELGDRVMYAFAEPHQQVISAGVAIRQNVKDASRLLLATVFALGAAVGMAFGYTGGIRTQNEINDRLDRIEQMVAPQAQPAPAAAPQVPAHKGKGK